ncbi:hypothetical protein GCM10010911_36310 [Paenibacillus nasutitermitis]|uniref:Uncharacterized protein n=1 Tax=Paenibacillus nasutitermitis TaxID=1652958 RepID=A0A916Z585_9BACL|nr:hypothetical protein GCM10010911_36310 [Paenibacillus nasutitermitis]
MQQYKSGNEHRRQITGIAAQQAALSSFNGWQGSLSFSISLLNQASCPVQSSKRDLSLGHIVFSRLQQEG